MSAYLTRMPAGIPRRRQPQGRRDHRIEPRGLKSDSVRRVRQARFREARTPCGIRHRSRHLRPRRPAVSQAVRRRRLRSGQRPGGESVRRAPFRLHDRQARKRHSRARRQVYARVTADTGKNVGDIEAADDTGKTVAVSGCTFMGPPDADGNTEIAYNI